MSEHGNGSALRARSFRPTCPRCCYRCDPGSTVCCECGTALYFTDEQLREIAWEARVGGMNAPQASDNLLTNDNPGVSPTTDRGRPTGHTRTATGHRQRRNIPALDARTDARLVG